MWMFISGMMVGSLLGFVVCGLLVANRRNEDCLDCDVLIARDATIAKNEEDIRSLTRTIDNLKSNLEQSEAMVHSLRTSKGILGREIQNMVFLHQKEA